jgi:hypothetical protein
MMKGSHKECDTIEVYTGLLAECILPKHDKDDV